MSANENEDEIKIEYLESFEKDPLAENTKYLSSDDNCAYDSISSNNPHDNLDEHVDFENEDLENHASKGNQEIEYFVVPENEESWFQLVDNSGRYRCRICDLTYSTIQTLRNHVKIKHPDHYSILKSVMLSKIRKQQFKCHVCKKRFMNKNDLQEHIQSHGLNNIQKSCHLCHAVFEKDLEIAIHMSNEHGSVKKKFNFCSLCGYSTSKQCHFKQHMNTHNRNGQKKCSHCEYTTNYPSNMRIHERIHTSDKPYRCKFEKCDYRCTTKSALYSHCLKHEKKKNMIYCDKCSYGTVYKQSLKKHMDSHTRNSVRTRF